MNKEQKLMSESIHVNKFKHLWPLNSLYCFAFKTKLIKSILITLKNTFALKHYNRNFQETWRCVNETYLLIYLFLKKIDLRLPLPQRFEKIFAYESKY